MPRYFIRVLYILLLIYLPCYAQMDQNAASQSNNADTLNSSVERSLRLEFLENNFYYYTPGCLQFDYSETSLAPSGYTPGLYMDYYMMQNGGSGNLNDIKLSMALKKQIEAQKSDISLLQQVLGAAQGAAVLYMGYRHIKKYGFK